ncbi:DUF4405 domain-containing protein [Treponema primitia]|uniref:DUF4405 domain-containing protein n=1 Tax=Treponema primitia TaxID=88058 RepID=UPI00397F7E4A
MKPKMILKLSIDFVMTVLLLVQMAFQVTGQEAHEWTGAGMFVLFLIHNILNINWYKNLLKGTYTAIRTFQTIINLLVLVTVIALAISGIIMSEYAFGFLSIKGGMAFARLLHLSAAYWAFVLMSMHLGLHWGMVITMFQKPMKRTPILTLPALVPMCIAIAIAVYGAWNFYKMNILSYMFLRSQFVFFDFEKNAFAVFAENTAMMGLWICAAYYAAKFLKKIHTTKKSIEAIEEKPK